MFIDTHCHLDFSPFINTMDKTLSAAQKLPLVALIVPAVTSARFDNINALIHAYHIVYGALGLHPMFKHAQTDLIALDKALAKRSDKIIAVGEIGLDKTATETHINEQIILLTEQLYLAKTYQLPVILHSRHTHDLLYKALKKMALPNRGVVHGFAGSYQQAMQFIGLGYAIGVGGTITYQRANKTNQTIAKIPLTSIVLETDAPSMPLCGFQGQSNRPEQIERIFHALCKLREEEPSHIQNQIYLNSKRLFNLPI